MAVEFYPLSQVRSLAEALDLVRQPLPGKVGINVDLLHLKRSGGDVSELAAVRADLIRYAQYCDGAATVEQSQWEWEASSQRVLPGAGVFDLAGFARALPPNVGVSVELPQEDALLSGFAGRRACAAGCHRGTASDRCGTIRCIAMRRVDFADVIGATVVGTALHR